jgi:hypothetical protein
MEVKTLKPHSNPRGDSFQKKAGDVYHLPEHEAAGLIAAGLVELVEDTTPQKWKISRGKPRHD